MKYGILALLILFVSGCASHPFSKPTNNTETYTKEFMEYLGETKSLSGAVELVEKKGFSCIEANKNLVTCEKNIS